MLISKIDLTEDQKNTLLPASVRGLLKKRDTTVYAALENEDILALVVIVVAETGMARHCIRYLNVYNDTAIEVLKTLLEEIENSYVKNGEKMLAVKIIDDISDHQAIQDFLIDYNYKPLQLKGRFLMYNFKDIVETDFFKQVENMDAIKNYVKFYRQMDRDQIVKLWDTLKKSDTSLDFETPDLVFGRFLVINGEIKGYMDIREVYPGVLMLYDTYVEKCKETKNAIPLMLGSVVQLSQAMMPENSVIILPLYSESLYKGVKLVFGEAVIEQGIFEYAKMICPEKSNSGTGKSEDEKREALLEAERKLETIAATYGTDILSPAMLKGQRDIYANI